MADTRRAAAIDPAIIERASRWMARLWSGEASDADLAACARWRSAHPDHELAWRRLQSMEDKLQGVPTDIARLALRTPPGAAMRRRVLGVLAAGAPAAVLAYLLRDTQVWRGARADYHSATGEIRTVLLPDGTRVVMDTGTAVNVRFDEQARHVDLLGGKILVRTGSADAVYRPFFVHGRHGSVQALGTVFSVQQDDDQSSVMVYEDAVDIRPALSGQSVRINAGQRVRFSRLRVDPVITPTVRDEGLAWSRGQLLADDMRIADLLTELGRYRHGIVRCDPTIADLRVTGVFPLTDSDRAFEILAAGLPVRAVYRSPYWVTVVAR